MRQLRGHRDNVGDRDTILVDECQDLVLDVFRSIRNHARHALEALRSCAADEQAIAAWAHKFRIDQFPGLVYYASYMRGEWVHYPDWAEKLTVGAAMHTSIRTFSPEYQTWAKRVHLPDPRTETREQWMQRAAKLYRKAATLTGPRPERWHAREMHAAWFVQQRVLGQSIALIAEKANCSLRAVELGIGRVESALLEWGDLERQPFIALPVPSHEK